MRHSQLNQHFDIGRLFVTRQLNSISWKVVVAIFTLCSLALAMNIKDRQSLLLLNLIGIWKYIGIFVGHVGHFEKSM